MPSRLSVCTLTRNEESNIERALVSVAKFADEVVVADTGSTDRTVEIAEKLGAKVLKVAWHDDFSSGRNAAIEASTGDWVLWINPDEEVISPSPEAIHALIKSAGEKLDFLGATIQDVPIAGRLDQFSLLNDIRLFRKRPDIRFTGRLHPWLDLESITREPGSFSPSEVVFRRHAYTSTLDESKIRWAIRLLELELRDRPGRLHYVIEYGRNLLLLNDPRGHEVMGQAVSSLRPYIDQPTPPNPEAQVLLDYAINTPAGLYRGKIAQGMAVALAMKWFPNSPPLLWSLAEVCFKTNQIRAAAGYLEKLLELSLSGKYDRTRSFDPRILGSWTLMNLGQCRRALGDATGARACFEALKRDPDFAAEAERQLTVNS